MKAACRLSETTFQPNGKIPLQKAIPLRLLHVLAMFVAAQTMG